MTPALRDSDSFDWSRLALSEEASDLATLARQHFGSLEPLTQVRHRIDASATTDLWPQLIDGGYPLVGAPDRFDGVGDLLDAVVVLEQAGGALVGDHLLSTMIATQALGAAGVESLPPGRGAFGVAALIHRDPWTTAETDVLDGLGCDWLAMLVRTDEGADLVVVDPGSESCARREHAQQHDPSRPFVSMRLHDARADTTARSLRVETVEAILAVARICCAADLVGLAGQVLERAIEHVMTRRQFERPIGSFQAVKHQIADLFVAVETARSLTRGAALYVGADLPERTAQLSLLAWATAVETARTASARLVQLQGAMGVTFESDAHLFFRRARQTSLMFESPRDAFAAAARLEGVR